MSKGLTTWQWVVGLTQLFLLSALCLFFFGALWVGVLFIFNLGFNLFG